MKKIYFLLFTLIATASFGQIEVFNAGGGGAYPSAGWSDTNNVTAQSIDKGSYYLVESGDPSDEILTAVYDLSAYASAEFSLDVASYGGGDYNPAKIEISFDGGTSFTQTELSTVTTGSSYIDGGTFTLNSVTSQVQIKISNNGVAERGVRLRNLILTGISSDPFIAITSPSDNAVFPSGTTNVDVSIDVQNFNVANGTGDGHIRQTLTTPSGTFNEFKYDTTDQPIAIADGESFTVFMELVDNSNNPIIPAVNATVNFSVAFPCTLELGAETATCVAETAGTDTYNATLAFTGGNTSTYTIMVNEGTVGGDNPSTMVAGTITINGITEGVDLEVTITGDVGNSSCNLDTTIGSPTCVPSATCPSTGAIIITEVMQNPAAASDPAGEYFEVYNTTGTPIDMIGWIIKDEASALEVHTIGSSLIVPAMGYIVIGNEATTAPALDYNYANDISLGNGTDGLILECSGSDIDSVIWDNGSTFPDPSGAAMELSITALNGTDNDNGANWGIATNDLGNGDLGTPGAANDFSLSVNAFEANKFNVYPNPVTNGLVNITSKSNEGIAVTVFDILGKQVISQTVNNNVLNVATLTSGVYILKLSQNGNVTTKKLVIK
ncbi:T9SS type A sorting domain-containing protein [Lacinutrix sp. MEBiC02404]